MPSTLASRIESILFLSGSPVTVQHLEKVLKAKRSAIEAALHDLADHYRERGIVIVRHGDAWQFGTAPENAAVLEELAKSEFTDELSKAALETLAVIAYKGPLTRVEIDYIRGVNSSFSIRNLLLRGLVERNDNPKDSRSYLYQISMDLLRHLGLRAREELPQWEEFRASLAKLPEDESSPDTINESPEIGKT